MKPFAPILTFSKFLGFFSKPTRSKFLLGYNVTLMVTFTTLLTFALLRTESDTSLSTVVSNLQWFSYVALFFANWFSNWRSKYEETLVKVEMFDQKLQKFSIHINYKKMKQNFFVFITTSVGLFIYVGLANLLLSPSVLKWSTFYFAFTMNFFTSVLLVFSLFLLRQRFYFLKLCLRRIISIDTPFKIKNFTDLYMELVLISNSLISQFSLRISTFLFFVLVNLTTDVYIVLGIGFDSSYDYWMVTNCIAMHLVEVVTIVYSCYRLRLEARKIVALSPKLLVISGSKRPSIDVVECFFQISNNRLGVSIFAMFCLDPSTLLSIAGSIIGYLIILLQFGGAEYAQLMKELDEEEKAFEA